MARRTRAAPVRPRVFNVANTATASLSRVVRSNHVATRRLLFVTV